MPYITIRQTPRCHQLTYDDIISREWTVQMTQDTSRDRKTSVTVTRFRDVIEEETLIRTPISEMISALRVFNIKYKPLFDAKRHDLYYEFHIPKRSGGLRKISAPNDPLMKALRELKEIFENQFSALYHTSAYAYVEGRSTIDAIRRHQANDSKWFLKTDCSDFFGSTSHEFIMRMLSMIYPFSEVMKRDDGNQELRRAVDLCMLDGGLPQGTPISPMLTNLVMIPIDHVIANALRKRGFIYTRYADDMMISHKKSFMFTHMVKEINDIFVKFHAPYTLKREKTRYGSRNGANWNLGVMLNKDNQITIGDRKRDNFRGMASNFIESVQNKRPWEIRDIQIFSGLISYYLMVEPDFVNNLRATYQRKFGMDFVKAARDMLR